MLFLSLKTTLNEMKSSNTDHVQPQNSLFTSDSQHPPRSRHAVHLGGICPYILLEDKLGSIEILLHTVNTYYSQHQNLAIEKKLHIGYWHLSPKPQLIS